MKLLLCDGHQLLLDALEVALLSRGHDVVGSATRVDEVPRVAERTEPDVCLLDLHLPGGSSLSVINGLRRAGVEVIILSGNADSGSVVDAVARGASGYLRKEAPMDDLVSAIDLACRGYVTVEAALLQRSVQPQELDEPRRALLSLTGREREVLRCVVDGMSTDEIARELHVSRNTARTHVHNVLGKLDVHSRVQAAALASVHGRDLWDDDEASA